MPKVSKDSTELHEHGPVSERIQEVDGYAIQFVTFNADIDATPLLRGLPGDHCSCPHWGYVFKGRVTFRFGDHDEEFHAGEAFYTPPGHIPVSHEPGSEILMFSPADELRTTSEAMQRNMAAMQPAG